MTFVTIRKSARPNDVNPWRVIIKLNGEHVDCIEADSERGYADIYERPLRVDPRRPQDAVVHRLWGAVRIEPMPGLSQGINVLGRPVL